MKFLPNVLVAAFIITIVVCACTSTETATAGAGSPAALGTPPAKQFIPHAISVATVPGNYQVYKVCIEGISYLLYDNKAIIPQVSTTNSRVLCEKQS